MSLARSLGRVGGFVVALVGAAVAYFGLVAAAPNVTLGTRPATVGPLTAFDLLGVGGVLLAVVGLAVVAGRGRAAAVSVGGLLAVVGFVVLALPLLAWPVALAVLAVGLVLFFAGASLNGHRSDAA